MAYEIKTFINRINDIRIYDDAVTIMLFVNSNSNLVPVGVPVFVSSTEQLSYYFPDCLVTTDSQLQMATRLLNNGYNVLAVNIHKALNTENLTVLSDNGSYWYDPNVAINFNQDYIEEDNLAVKIDLSKIGKNFQFLFEHIINKEANVSRQCYFYSDNVEAEDKLNQQYYQIQHAHKIEFPELYQGLQKGWTNIQNANPHLINTPLIPVYFSTYTGSDNPTGTLADYGWTENDFLSKSTSKTINIFGMPEEGKNFTALLLYKDGVYNLYYAVAEDLTCKTVVSKIKQCIIETTTIPWPIETSTQINDDKVTFQFSFGEGAYTDTITYKIYDNAPNKEGFETLANNLSEALLLENYTTFYDKDSKILHIAYPYSFKDISFTSEVVVEQDEAFQEIYKQSFYTSKLSHLDIKSKYLSDIADLEIEFNQQGPNYSVYVYKTYQDSIVIDVESYTNTDLIALFDEINNLSHHVIIENPLYIFPNGTFSLKQLNPIVPSTYEDYLDTLLDLQAKVNQYDLQYAFNMIFEPDLRNLIENEVQKEYVQFLVQAIINQYFSDPNIPIIKLFNYLYAEDLINNMYSCYFFDGKCIYNENEITYKELYLQLLTKNSLGTTLDNSIKFIDLPSDNLPYFVNVVHKNHLYNTIDEIKCIKDTNIFNIKDLLVISCMNVLLNNVIGTTKEDAIISQKNIVEQYYIKYFNYSPNITIASIIKKNDIVTIELNYNTQLLNEVNKVELVLNLKE